MKVYKFGCRAPSDPRIAEQLLGQAWQYREDLRRVYNDSHRRKRPRVAAERETAHVRAYEEHRSRTEYMAHVFARSRALMWSGESEQTNAEVCVVRAARGHLLDWGTYSLIETSMLAASKASKLDPIRRQNWDGTGKLGAFIQSDHRFPASNWDSSRVNLTAPDAKGHAVLTIRFGPIAKAVTLDWPIKLHRPFPKDAIVVQVAVQRVREGHRYRWQALITISEEESQRDLHASGTVGIDIGWRHEGILGQRVATHDGSDGDRGVLRTDVLSAFEYADAVRGIRDINFDQVKKYAKTSGIPGAEYARTWKDKERMRRLAAKTKDLGAVWWRERDRHLEDIECAARRRGMSRRLNAYRVYADFLAKRFARVALEDMRMSTWVGEAETHAKERRRSTAALYLLQLAIAQRFGAARVDWVPPAYTSMTCSACGDRRKKRLGAEAEWTCEVCSVTHHRDENAAKNIRANSERWSDAGNPPRARKAKAVKEKGKRKKDGIATGDEIRMHIIARDPLANAAE